MKTAKKSNSELILQGNLMRAILTLTIPVVINSFLSTMYSLTDAYWLGRLGTNQLAATNLVGNVQVVIITFGSGITVAGAVLIAQYVGAKAKKDAQEMANQIFACAIAFAVVCSAVCFLATPAIVRWLGAEGEVFTHAKAYLGTVIWDIPFIYMVNIFVAVYQAQGDTFRPMLLNVGGIIINLILDPLFIVVLDKGARGAALATLLAEMVPAIVAFILLSNPKKEIHLEVRNMKFQKEKLKLIVQIGLPTAIGGSILQLGFLIMSRNVFKYGTAAMAAYGIGNRINGLITMPSNGISAATSTIVAQNVGAKQPERAEKGCRVSMWMIVSFLVVGGLVLSRLPICTAIVSIFSKDAEVIALAADFVSVIALWSFANGVIDTTSALFQGTGHTEITMVVSIARLWVFRFATLWILENIFNMGVRSIWYCVSISNGICAIILYILYRSGVWKKQRIKLDKGIQEEA